MGTGIALTFVFASFVILFFSPQLAFAESEKEHLIALKSIKKFSSELSDFAVIEFRVTNHLDQDLDFSDKDIVHLKNSKNKFYQSTVTNQLKSEFSIECTDSGKLVTSGLTKEILLCFEVPKDDKEDYLLVIDKDKTILDKSKEIQVYLNSHDIIKKFSTFDLRPVFFTIHDVKTKSISGFNLLILELTVYNGYAPVNEYGKPTPVVIPLEGKRFFVTDLKGNDYSALSTQYSNTGYEEYCPKTKDLHSDKYGYFVFCFDIPKSTQKNTEYWLILNNLPAGFHCVVDCQQKMWSLLTFMSSSPEPEPLAEPSSITEVQKIPDWVKNTFKWYVEGAISEDEMISAIQFLIKEGIIKI